MVVTARSHPLVVYQQRPISHPYHPHCPRARGARAHAYPRPPRTCSPTTSASMYTPTHGHLRVYPHPPHSCTPSSCAVLGTQQPPSSVSPPRPNGHARDFATTIRTFHRPTQQRAGSRGEVQEEKNESGLTQGWGMIAGISELGRTLVSPSHYRYSAALTDHPQPLCPQPPAQP
jgi:hypothetical protein